MNKISTKKIVFSGLFIALGLVMPFLTAQVPSIGSKLLPMHIPVLLGGFILGWPCGLIIGFIVPILRSMLFGMPPMFPTAIAMAFELATYGLVAGFLYKIFPRKNIFIYITLILSMISGRIIWGAVSIFLYGLNGAAFSWKIFMSGGLVNAIPGIIIQIIIIPIILIALERTKLIQNV